jgi:uncharacterized protein YbjQ (UPF0145 family)
LKRISSPRRRLIDIPFKGKAMKLLRHIGSVTFVIGLFAAVFAIWLGKDLSAIVRLILGGELTEYTEMMGSARSIATERMTAKAAEMGADAIINVRYMMTSVVGCAAELLVYGTDN